MTNVSELTKYLQEKVRAYEKKVSELQAQRDALEAEITRLQVLLKSAQALLHEERRSSGLGTNAEAKPDSLIARLANMTLSAAIFEIVYSNPDPIHADLVLKKLREAGKAPKGKTPKNTVVSLLHRGIEKGIYEKVGPNLFVAAIREER